MFNKELFEKEQNIFFSSDLEKFKSADSIYVNPKLELFNIDFSNFGKLKHLRCDIPNKLHDNIGALLNLEQLILFNVNFKKDDLLKLVNLEFLTLTRGNIRNLDFVKSMKSLKSIELNFLNKLISINSLIQISKQIIHLEIYSCKKIEDLVPTLVELKNLKVLKLIKMSIEEISWVKELPKLEQLIICESNILSGDISPARDIDYVAIDNKRHYNYRFDDELMKIFPK